MNTKQLIPVLNGNIAGESTPLVNARELHTYCR